MPTETIDKLKDRVGESKTVVEDLHVEAGKVEEFARAIKDENPIFRSEEAARERGFDAIPAPLTFTRTSRFPRYRPEGVGVQEFDLPLVSKHTVHAEHEYEYDRPLLVGDTLTGIATITDAFQKYGSGGTTLTFVIIETEYVDENDEPVVTDRKTLVESMSAEED